MTFNYKHIRFLFLALTVLLLSSCYTQKDKRLLQEAKSLPQYSNELFKDYLLQINDELYFRLLTSDEDFLKLIETGNVSTQQRLSYRIFTDGTVDMPFASSIKVEGLTIEQATEEVRKHYAQLVSDAEVKLALANKTFTIIGEAGSGVFPIYKDKMTIYQALAQSGAIALSADRKHVKIVRETNGVPQILEFDIRPKSVIDSKYYYIYPNDIIYVQKDAASFYKTNSYSGLMALITSSLSLLTTVFYYTKFVNK
ncbi:MAG: hypothetical protein GX102_04230 [Porphyromonadaceae bacterium]|nr:hypothetical protein [Porphyromonadaceae bacterium]